MEKLIICLANSYKHGGRCIAGIEIRKGEHQQWDIVKKRDGSPQWIRPISRSTPTGEIPPHECNNIPIFSIIRLLDIEPTPTFAHSENVYYQQMQKIEKIECSNQLLDCFIDHVHSTLFYNSRKSISPYVFEQGDYSLMMIKADSAHLYQEKRDDKTKPRIRFRYLETEYDMPITDPLVWEKMRLGSLRYGDYKNLYLALSLGVLHEGWHPKLVTTVIESLQTQEISEENDGLKNAWDFVEHTGRSIFLTGKAGTGKTTFLKTVVERSKKRLIVVAPTGVAAINAGGMTIHSFFQLPFTPYVPNAHIKSKYDFGKEKRRIIASLDLLIIDEISMVRSDLLDAIDSVLRKFRDRYKPFGGVQLLMVGDLQQLTPVVTPEDEIILKPYYDTPYFFGSKALQQIDYVTIQLEKVYRQEDDVFLDVLNHIREAHPSAEDLAILNKRYNPQFIPKSGDGYIRLTTHNYLADHYNDNELAKLTTVSYTYQAKIEGNFPEYSYPTNESLTLKQRAQVMFVKNDPSGNHRYYNGRIGEIVEISDSRVCVLCPGDDEAIEVEPLTWENAQYQLNPETREIETKVQGKFHQLPLRLAWAITIHKSQGLTFDRVIIDANLSFAPGQVYVALSRCKTLEGIVLSAPVEPHAIISDQRVDSYISRQEEEAHKSIEQLPLLKEEYHRFLLLELFDFHNLFYKEEHLVRLMTEFFYHSHTDITEFHKRVLDKLKNQIMTISDKWLQKICQLSVEQMHQDDFMERVKRSAAYFEESIRDCFTNSLELAASIKTNNKQAMSRFGDSLMETRQAVLSRRYLLARIAEQGFSITAYLHEKQYSLLDALDEKQINKKREKKKKEPKEKTWNITLQMYQQGLKPEEIAKERNFTIGTIIGHLARFIPTGEVALSELVPPEHQETILKVVQRIGAEEGKTAIKNLCPPDITYQEIELVMSIMEK